MTSPTLLLILAAFIAAPVTDPRLSSTTAPGACIEVPFEMSPRGHIMVDVSIDGAEPVPFALDTGAGISVVNRLHLDALGLEEREGVERVQRAHGSASLGRSDVAALSVGDTSFGELEVGVMDLADVEAGVMAVYGIIGYDVLSRHDVSLDFQERTVDLCERADDPADCEVCRGEISTDFALANGTHIQFDVAISGETIEAILDTGSSRSGMNSLAADAIGVALPETMPGGHAPQLNVGEIRMGGGSLARRTPVGVIDLPVFEALGLADGPAILLGTGTLVGRRVGISYGLKRIFVQ